MIEYLAQAVYAGDSSGKTWAHLSALHVASEPQRSLRATKGVRAIMFDQCTVRMSHWTFEASQLQCAAEIYENQEIPFEITENEQGRFAIFVPPEYASHSGMESDDKPLD